MTAGVGRVRYRSIGRAGALVVGVLVGAFGLAAAASAHVTVTPNTAPQGGEARIAFSVPTESDTASTVKLQVFFDTDHPVASVSTMPVPGWTAVVTTRKLTKPLTDDDGNQVTQAVSEITWMADSAATAIKPGEFDEFPISLGPLPSVGSLVFKALQTYSDATIVRWIDLQVPGGPEPEHPAPVLTLVPTGGGSSAPTSTATVPATASSGSDSGAITLGTIGILLGLVGAILGGAAYARTRGSTPAGN